MTDGRDHDLLRRVESLERERRWTRRGLLFAGSSSP
jgi:hypothetical protein